MFILPKSTITVIKSNYDFDSHSFLMSLITPVNKRQLFVNNQENVNIFIKIIKLCLCEGIAVTHQKLKKRSLL